MTKTELAPVRARRSYPKAKAQVVAECGEPNASIDAVALSHGLNANLVHKWLRLASAQHEPSTPAFVPVLAGPSSAVGQRIEIRVQRGEVQASLHWPVSAADACAAWLREWLQ
ncbi:transposase [Achromobacter sp. GG226]|uniref:transposase n=1 Tax=Verticiella alkaliphila TaxID=2779529 RepID=UPI001C0CDFB6|nr:transposase [Verticiella sp. GG226]MBU4609900.1 transposase [Verticiella sp. GG226]